MLQKVWAFWRRNTRAKPNEQLRPLACLQRTAPLLVPYGLVWPVDCPTNPYAKFNLLTKLCEIHAQHGLLKKRWAARLTDKVSTVAVLAARARPTLNRGAPAVNSPPVRSTPSAAAAAYTERSRQRYVKDGRLVRLRPDLEPQTRAARLPRQARNEKGGRLPARARSARRR